MTRDEHEQTALMGGSAFQETGMDDHLTRVAEAVRAACFEACNENGGDMGAICTVDLPAVIASVPRPESVAAQATVPDGWKLAPVEPSIAACIIGSNAAGGAIDGRQCAVVYRAMLAAAPEATQPDDDDFELTCPEPPARDDRKAIKRLSDAVSAICAQAGESEDEFTKWLADGGMLELLKSSIKAMKLEKAVEAAGKKNAALVAAMQNITDEFVPGDEQKLYGTPTDVLDRIRSTAWAALASAKGGAE